MSALRICPSMEEFKNHTSTLRPVYISGYGFPYNKPSGVSAYGAVFRTPNAPPSDCYYLFIDTDRRLYVGTQLNGASSITWRSFS